jgi:hypothetical protein
LKAGLELLKPAPDDLLQKWPASRRVNNSRASDDDPTLINDNVISPAKADTEKGKRERLVRLHKPAPARQRDNYDGQRYGIALGYAAGSGYRPGLDSQR